MDLTECFSHVKGQIMLVDPLPNITKKISLVVQEEKQRKIGSVKNFVVDFMALMSKKMIDSASINYVKQLQQQRRYKFLYTLWYE